MPGRISMLMYDEAEGEDDLWAISVYAPDRSFVVFATLGAPRQNISSDHLVLHFWHEGMPQTDGDGLNIEGRGVTPLILGEPDNVDIDWYIAYSRSVSTYEAAILDNQFTTSQLWAWSFVEGLVEKGIVDEDALVACRIEKRNNAIRRAKAKARLMARVDHTKGLWRKKTGQLKIQGTVNKVK